MEYANTDVKGPPEFVTGPTRSDYIVVDVREREEFDVGHLNGSLNIPLSNFRLDLFESIRNEHIFLICNSGARAAVVAKRLDLLGFNNVQIAKAHIDRINTDLLVGSKLSTDMRVFRWSVDRQFRLVLGLILLISLTLYYYGFTAAIYVPAFLGAALCITAAIDWCGMRIAIGMLPWNK